MTERRKGQEQATFDDETQSLTNFEIEDSDLAKKNKGTSKKIQKKVRKQKRKLDERSPSQLAALNDTIPCTNIPVRHFKAMIKKEQISWKRNYKRSLLEVSVPCIMYIVLAIIRVFIQPQVRDYGGVNLMNFANTLFPLPDALRAQNLSIPEMVVHAQKSLQELEEFYKFQNMTTPQEQLTHSPFTTWLSDNCGKTDFNEARQKWAVIYENEEARQKDLVTQDVQKDITQFVTFRRNAKQIKEEFEKVSGKKTFSFDADLKFGLDQDPVVFNSEAEFHGYLADPNYEAHRNSTEDLPGICFGFHIKNNLWKPSFKDGKEAPEVEYRFFTEMTEGSTVSMRRSSATETNSQMTIPTSANPPQNRFEKDVKPRATELYIRQGYLHIQNWVANAVLRALTGNSGASITQSIAPMLFRKEIKDEFEDVLSNIYSYVGLIIYILPMYSYIQRIQIEKQSGIKRHLVVVGLSRQAQLLAMFCSYAFQITLIAFNINLVMYLGGLFPTSFSNSKFLMFLYSWVQGISNFGFIVMISALLPQDMYPKLAAKWGTIIYFGSSFADFTVQKPGIAEIKKVIICIFFPTIASARASRNLSKYEYIPGGTGLDWDMLWEPYQEFRIGTYFIIMAWAFVSHLVIGLLFENFGSITEIWRNFKRYILFIKSQEEIEAAKIKNIKKEYELDYFEGEDDQTQIGSEENQDELLVIKKLIKRFRQQTEYGNDGNEEQKYFSAVDQLSLKLYQGQIFSLLGHNGAGKTTTISILTGMLEASSGEVTCFGRTLIDTDKPKSSLKNDIAYIRQIIGICPQYDILFDFMTVREHLDFFCDFKGVDPDQKELKITKIMKDVDVYKHRDTQTKSLSGGNRRKLSVALALVADSKFVLLDEPTSSLDLTARRRLWDMLRDYKKDRIIVLTTHNMDEADLLGDRIGIMKSGQLVCLGSSEFLKSKFGYGYRLKIQRNKEIDVKGDFQQMVHKYVTSNLGQKVALTSSSQQDDMCTDLVFQMDNSMSKNFAAFFRKLDIDCERLAIKQYTISVTSLEEVFLAVGQQDQQIQKSNDTSVTADEPIKDDIGTDFESISAELEDYRVNQQRHAILCTQTCAMISRKMRAYRRSFFSTVFEIMVPVILLGVGFCFTKLEFDLQVVERHVVPESFPWSQRLMINKRLVLEPTESSLGLDEDFDDDEPQKQKINLDLQDMNLDPTEIVKNLPKFEQNAFHIEYHDVDKGLRSRALTEGEYMELPLNAEGQKIQAMKEEDKNAYFKKLAASANATEDHHVYNINGVNVSATDFGLQEFIKNHEEKMLEEKQAWEGQLTAAHKWREFAREIYERRGWDENEVLQNDQNLVSASSVYPYRYGSFYFYEANNATKQFKVATYVNMTSNDVTNYFSHYLYTAIIRTASGRSDLNFTTSNVPFPKSPRNPGHPNDANGIFVAFCVGISYALIPASIISRIVHEKERGLQHLQRVSGVDMKAYWLSFYIFDILKTYVACLLTWALVEIFHLHYLNIELVLLMYPWAVVPYSYVSSYIYNRETTAQTFSIYSNFLLSGMAAIIVFALRMVEGTALWGDRIMWVMRLLCPSFDVCNAIIYASSRDIMARQRNIIRRDLDKKLKYQRKDLIPRVIDKRASLFPNSLGGDILVLMFLAVFWTGAFIYLEKRNTGLFENTFSSDKGMPPKKSDEELNLDEDVRDEEKRVQEEGNDSLVSVNKFRKVYKVPFSKPVLAVEKASFAVDEGECFALLGVNGAGKSTTFKSLTNVVTPTDGLVQVAGENVSEDFETVRHKIGYCPQQDSLFTGLTVMEHMQYYAVLKGLPPKYHSKFILHAIKRLGIQKYANRPAEKLSGGNKRKLQVAIAILGNPLVIMLDEPSAGMDPAARRFMWGVVGSITKSNRNSCVILTTHTMEEAEALSTKMGIMVQGGIFMCFGTPDHIKDKFGGGYEIEVRMKSRMDSLGDDLDIDGMSRADILNLLVRKKYIQDDQRKDFEQSLGKYSSPHEALTSSHFKHCLNCYLTQHRLIQLLLKHFGRVEVLESYGTQYIKVRVPKLDKTVGYIFGLIEGDNFTDIQQYSVNQTSLEMIFNYFAQGGRGASDINQIQMPNDQKGGLESQVIYQLSEKEDKIKVIRQETGVLLEYQIQIHHKS